MEPLLRWPPAPDEPPLVRIETGTLIARPAEKAFAFATHAALWHHWHPATAGVSSVPDRPLLKGDQVTESIRSGPRSFSATWTVLACETPTLWVIATRTDEGDSRIVYEVAPEGNFCRFQRTLEYRSRRWPWTMFDTNLTRWTLERQSQRAIENLKRLLEGGFV